jgi:hypothetical protein
METHKLSRTGQAPLEFEGSLLQELTTRRMGGGYAEQRWHEVGLYRCDDGAVLAHVRYGTQWIPGEAPTSEVFEAAQPEALLDELRAVNPCVGFVGRPERHESERTNNAPKNELVRKSLRDRWLALLSEVASALEITERRRGPGRPALSSEPLVQVGIKIPQDLKEEIDRDRGKTTMSEWLRAAAEAYLAREKG